MDKIRFVMHTTLAFRFDFEFFSLQTKPYKVQCIYCSFTYNLQCAYTFKDFVNSSEIYYLVTFNIKFETFIPYIAKYYRYVHFRLSLFKNNFHILGNSDFVVTII